MVNEVKNLMATAYQLKVKEVLDNCDYDWQGKTLYANLRDYDEECYNVTVFEDTNLRVLLEKGVMTAMRNTDTDNDIIGDWEEWVKEEGLFDCVVWIHPIKRGSIVFDIPNQDYYVGEASDYDTPSYYYVDSEGYCSCLA